MVRAPCADIYASRSCLVMRPPAPLPFTWRRSMPYSPAILRPRGDSGPAGDSASAAGAGSSTGIGYGPAERATGSGRASRAGGAGAFAAGGPGAGFGAGGAGGAGAAFAAAGAGADAPLPAPSSIRPTTVLIATVLPSSTRTSFNTPAAGDGHSVSTLSVEISNKGSSRSTCSPGFLSHLVKVPSTILSPIWGITTSVMQLSPSMLEPAMP